MSFIRPRADNEPRWIEQADVTGLYVYSDGDRIHYMPKSEPEFVEVVMRMLEQSGELDEETLQSVNGALQTRLNLEDGRDE